MNGVAQPDAPCSITRLTAARPGAIAVLQLHGHPNQLEPIVRSLCDCALPEHGSLRFSVFRDDDGHIDEGLLIRLMDDTVQLMPHGGPRVQQRILARCASAGASMVSSDDVDPCVLYPEARDEFEAYTLHALAQAVSPRAIDLLLAQPDRLRSTTEFSDSDHARAERLNRLITPATVVLAGPANVGKSTLSNALLGRSMSIAVDEPGTTRDYTMARIDFNGVVAHWCDTPGLRSTDDRIEQSAIAHAQTLWKHADVLIAITDADHDWPALDRAPDLRVANKCDLKSRDDADLNFSAKENTGIQEFVARIRHMLVSDEDLSHAGPWCFHPALQQLVQRTAQA